jgi:uncharacterized protein YndB with AHSA1/START domain
MTAKSAARAVADVTAGSILASVEIAASPERVFKAIASDEIAKWWGSPQLYRVTAWVGDVKPGGKFKSTGVGHDGKPFSVEGEFLEVDPPRKLVHTWKPQWQPELPATTVTYRLEAVEGGTRITLKHEGFGNQAGSCRDHANGWERVFSWLTAFVAPSKLYFHVRLLPPRPTFMTDMNEAEGQVMKEHGAYWAQNLMAGNVLIYGPVADPKGGWGVGVIAVDSEEQARQLEANDPAIKSGRGFKYERLPMLRALY